MGDFQAVIGCFLDWITGFWGASGLGVFHSAWFEVVILDCGNRQLDHLSSWNRNHLSDSLFLGLIHLQINLI
jgi:hypothetical protein